MRKVIDEIEREGDTRAGLDPVRVRTGIERAHVETALAVHLHCSFRKAAQALGMLPSTVNKRIRGLEFQLGCAVFERQRKRLVPTLAGRVFLRHSGRILRDFHTMVEAVRRIADGKAGHIAIGFHGSAIQNDLYSLLFDAGPFAPHVQRRPVELAHDHLFEALATRQIDVALVRGQPRAFVGEIAPLWRERLIVCLPDAHPLALAPTLEWRDLASETFLVSGHDPSDAIRSMLEDRFAPLGVAARILVHDIGLTGLLRLVGKGHGICLCLDSILGDHYAGTVFRELSGAAGPEYVTSFACWHDDDPHPALDRFLRQLLRRYRSAGS